MKESTKYLLLAMVVSAVVIVAIVGKPNKNYPPQPELFMELTDATVMAVCPVHFGKDILYDPFGIDVLVLKKDGKNTVNFYVPDEIFVQEYVEYQTYPFRALLSYPNLVKPGKIKIGYLRLRRSQDPKLPGVEWVADKARGFYQSK